MYITKKETKYFLIDLLKNSTKTFEDKDELFYFLLSGPGKVIELYFNEINMNGNDLESIFTIFPNERRYLSLRRFLFLDSKSRIIDIRKWRKDIEGFDYNAYKELNCPKNKTFRFWKKQRNAYVFRKGPVPGTGKVSRHRYYKRLKATQERKYACDKEHIPYIRAKRNFSNIPNYYDDELIRYHDSCWKSKKIKRQWMKNLK